MGIKPLVSAHDVTPNFLRFCTYMSTNTISSRNADAVNFVAAEIEAFRHAMADKADTLALTKEIIKPKADDPRPEYIYDLVVKLHAIDPEMSIPMDKLKWMENLFKESGTLKSDIDLKKFVDASVREKALAIVGPPKK
jgi:ABC-type nitrate/sulfonate/bicarbonate transport system substrate-binding protein